MRHDRKNKHAQFPNMQRVTNEAFQGFGGTGETGHLFQGNRGTKAKFRGEQGNKDNIGEQET